MLKDLANFDWFIDDIKASNDDGESENSFKEIYTLELEFKKENIVHFHGSFLHLNIKN